MLFGTIVIYAFGLAWLGTVVGWDKPVLAWGLTPFLLGDLLKLALRRGPSAVGLESPRAGRDIADAKAGSFPARLLGRIAQVATHPPKPRRRHSRSLRPSLLWPTVASKSAPIAGATWIMRAPIRQEPFDRTYVAIGKIDELRRVDISGREIAIGACVTHAQLAAALANVPECNALTVAGRRAAANPAIRQVATIGGNLCTAGFAASDLVPALLCLDADIEVATPGWHRADADCPIPREARQRLPPATLLTRIIIPRNPARSVHVRLPLRKAGDYPVAILSLAAAIGPDGSIEAVRVAVGSVETVARRWETLEAELRGRRLDPQTAFELADANAATFEGRDGIEAPGWYRVKVLPSLVRRAAQALLERS